MGLLEYFNFPFGNKEKDDWSERAAKAATYENEVKSQYRNTEYQIIETIFDGEKTEGGLGAPLAYLPDYTALSYRSWKAFTDSDLAQILVKATVNWVIGSGLKLQSEPNEAVIDSEGFDFNRNEFTKQVEDRFRLYARTNSASYSNMDNYNKTQRTAYFNAIVGGDVLCILRVKDGLPNVQLIDGIFVQTPGFDEVEAAKARNNEIIHGVEVNNKGTHVAFYVPKKGGGHTRIEAFGKNTKRPTAFLLYGTEYRIDSVRGLPLLSAVLEKITKLDRYNEAVVAGAEESAKVPWFFEHKEFSTGLNPDLGHVTNMLSDPESQTSESRETVDMTEQGTIIKKTYEKQPINMPIGATIKKLESGMAKDQDVFTTGNFIYISAALETPYEVALMKYVNSFSSSRMASQSYLTILKIKRSLFNDAYNNKFFELFLDLQILTDKIKADGYFSAKNKNDVILLQAYRNARFTGHGVPQADPNREVNAEVTKIANNLSTHEASIERLDGNDFDTTVRKLGKEHELIDEVMPKEEQNTEGAD